ncbi:membrane protein [Rhodopirellula sallentina SM41]|uniref:Membrane protein n=2 Tax=Rhodopirellula TaxID=265488 RepID=M5TYN5_9BACT|nr:membrane protein [Rhodopirellula sallentina SM41]
MARPVAENGAVSPSLPVSSLLGKGDGNASAILKLLRLALVFFVRATSASGSLLLAVAITEFATIESLGLFTVLQSGLTFMGLLARGGMGVAYLRAGSRMQLREDLVSLHLVFGIVRNCMVRRGVVLGGIGALAFWGYLQFSSVSGAYVGLFFGACVPASVLLALASEHFKSKSLVDVSLMLTPGVVALLTASTILALTRFEVFAGLVPLWLIVVVYICVYWAVALSALLMVQWVESRCIRKSSCDHAAEELRKITREIQTAGPRFLAIQLLTYGTFGGLFLLAGFFFDGKELGVVRLSERLATPVMLVLSIVNPLIAAPLAQLYGEKKIDQLKLLVWSVSRVCVGLAVLLVLINLAFIDWFLADWVNAGLVSVPLVVVVLLGNAINLACGPLGMVLSMANQEKMLERISLCTMVVTVVLCCLMTFLFGPVGFCLAIAISYSTKNLLMYRVYKKVFFC